MSDDPISRKALVEEIDGKPLFKLVEADGGLWKYEAVESIKKYIKENLDPEFNSRITVIG